MTVPSGLLAVMAHLHFVHISPDFALPEGEGFQPSPDGDTNDQLPISIFLKEY